MRLYNVKSATPLASSSAKRAPPRSFLPNLSSAKPLWSSTPSPRQSENECAFESTSRNQECTSGRNSPKIYEKSTASTASSESFDGLIGRFSESFHFDIDIVKEEKVMPLNNHGRDDFSSSSTLTSVSKEVANPFSPFERSTWPAELNALPAPCKVDRRRLSSAGAHDPFWNSDVRHATPSSSRNLYSVFRGASAQSRNPVLTSLDSEVGLFPTQQRADLHLPESRDDEFFGANRFPSIGKRESPPATPPFSVGKPLAIGAFAPESSVGTSWVDFSGDCSEKLFSGNERATKSFPGAFSPIESPSEPPQKAFHVASPTASHQKSKPSPSDVSSCLGTALDYLAMQTGNAANEEAANRCCFGKQSANRPIPAPSPLIHAFEPQQKNQTLKSASVETQVKSGHKSSSEAAVSGSAQAQPNRENVAATEANKARSSQRRAPVLLGHLLEKRYQSELRKKDARRHKAPVTSKEDKQSLETRVTCGLQVPLDSIPTKYAKMMKVGLPLPVVRQAMERDGVDPSVLDGKPSEEDACAKRSLPEKYAKMLKVGLPVAAVKQAMQRDGVDPSILHDGAPTSLQTSAPSREVVPKDPYRRFRVHWEPHGNIRSNTLWAMVKRDQPWLAEVKVDEEEMANLFKAERNPTTTLDLTKKKDVEKSVCVVDPKRANNGGIILARIKLSYRDIARAVDSYDESELTLEQIRGIIPLVPTKEEKQALQKHVENGGPPLKAECEKFMIEIMAVSDAKNKLEAMLFMKKFPICVDEIKNDARLIQKACDEIMGASRLRKLLGVVLHLGNMLNTAGPSGKDLAGAIKVESLLKLNQGKAFDKTTTFLQYTARIIRRNNPSLLQFQDEIPTLSLAELGNWEMSMEELDHIEASLTKLRRIALGDGESGDVELSQLAPDEEVRVLQSSSIGRFTLDACLRMGQVYGEVESSKLAFEALLNYFGEEDPTGPQEFLHKLSLFCRDFEAAVEQAIKSEKERVRENGGQPRVSSLASRKYVRTPHNLAGPRHEVKPGMAGVLADIRNKAAILR